MMWRRRAVAVTVLVAVTIGVAVLVGNGVGQSPRAAGGLERRPRGPTTRAQGMQRSTSTAAADAAPSARSAPHAPFAVGSMTLHLVDLSRMVRLADGEVLPRTLVTVVRYPALGKPGAGDHPGATPAAAAGPFPLIVFGHGFAVTPGIYASLLRAWAQAGYVVAAPVFPLGNEHAPGGPNERDLPSQPGDMTFVIRRMLAASAHRSGALAGLIAPRAIAVAGQSDGGDTALAVAYDPRYRDPRVGAAVILSGAEDPFISSFQIAPGGPPLLATQGTADTINPPRLTFAFYDSAPAPKFLLQLLGASHLPPYTYEQPQLGIVERVTIAFLDHYLKRVGAALRRMLRAGGVPGVATIDAHP